MIAGLIVGKQVILGAERAPLLDEGRATTLVDPNHVDQLRVNVVAGSQETASRKVCW